MRRKKRSLLSLAAFAASFLLALRRSDRRSRTSLAALKPQGTAAYGKTARPNRAYGQDADSPKDIPPRGWWSIAKRTAKKFSENELMSEAASVTFFALLSLFPAITAIVSIYGLFTNGSTIEAHLDSASGLIPSGGMDIIRDQVRRLTQSPSAGLSFGAVFGVLAALWSANQGTKAMFSALNDVYGEREQRGFVRVTATSLAFTAAGVVVLLLGLGLIVVLPLVFDAIGISSVTDVIVQIARWPAILLVIVVALAVLYRYGPSRRLARWRWVTWGSAIAAIAWVGLSAGFSWYVEHFGSYNKTYGSLGAIIGFMTWIWLSSTVLLLGAQINAEMETQTARDSTVGGDKPRGTRGAASADAVAPPA